MTGFAGKFQLFRDGNSLSCPLNSHPAEQHSLAALAPGGTDLIES
jgi:hypothetical protein